jgi:hypothetical protein
MAMACVLCDGEVDAEMQLRVKALNLWCWRAVTRDCFSETFAQAPERRPVRTTKWVSRLGEYKTK